MSVEAKPLWGELSPGPYAVAYTTAFAYDHARVYDMVLPTEAAPTRPKGPRPILINVWYPARQSLSGQPMRQEQYLELDWGQDEALGEFARRLIGYTREAACGEVMGQPEQELDAAARADFEQFCRTPTAAVKDGAAEKGPFPLLINHQGYGSAFVDNTVLFEFLASHGYVVVNTAYHSQDASVLEIDHDSERSFGDMAFLLHHMQGHPQADRERVGVIGHSYGAQSALAWLAEASPAVRAVVSLDTTFEYGPEEVQEDKMVWVNMSLRDVRIRFDRAPRVSVPLLIFTQARMDPDFSLYERLPHAERFYAQAKFVNHFHFVSLGVVGSGLRPHAIEGEGVGDARQIRKAYEQICRSTLSFLDGYLKDNAQALEWWRRAEGVSVSKEGEAGLITWQHKKAMP